MCHSTVAGSWQEPTQAQGEHANAKSPRPDVGFKPRTFLLWGNSAASSVHSITGNMSCETSLCLRLCVKKKCVEH